MNKVGSNPRKKLTEHVLKNVKVTQLGILIVECDMKMVLDKMNFC